MSETQHPKSKKIVIFRAGSFLSRAQGKEVDDFYATSKKSVGAYWETLSSKKIASGLTFAEENILMPHLVDAECDDKEFRKKVSTFFQDIDTKIPYNTGLTLEVGLELDNDKPIFFSKDPEKCNMPINIMDYIRWRHALKHPRVAHSKELADGSSRYEFYIFDKNETIKKNSKKSEEKDAAFAIYLEIKPDIKKVEMMLTLLGHDVRAFGNNPDTMIDKLRTESETRSDLFTKTYNGAELEINYWIKAMINTGVMKNIGPKYFDAETEKLIGNSLEETVYFFKDEENSDMVVALKARMQEGLSKPIGSKRGNTAPTK